MIALGVRAGPKKTRVAIVEKVERKFRLLNSDMETRLVYPNDSQALEDRMLWLYQEMDRLHHRYPEIARVSIKTNEYTATDTKSKRETVYLEAATLLCWRNSSIPVALTTYSSLGTRSKDVKTDAEHRVGKTEKYWDNQMADAIVAAWMVLRS